MSAVTSSQEMHPVSGARFVCERGEAGVYQFVVYVAGGATHRGELRWDAEGRAVAEPEVPEAWVQAEILKLARVLKHGQQARLIRWRGP